jgi:hypothetical protein
MVMCTLSKCLSEQGQEITQFIAVIKSNKKKEQGVKTSMHNSTNKPKISIKLPMYSGKLNKNVFI